MGYALRSMPRILAAIVLYRRPAQASEAFRSLTALAPPNIQLALFDNSPNPQPPPPGFQIHHDPANPGLARPYNLALASAVRQSIPWLLLLDQDTTVTPAFLAELASALAAPEPSPAAIVPRLADLGVVCSPAHPPTFGPARPVSPTLTGISPHPLFPFNSGAVLRVSALQAIGGFSPRFPLDYLDHATFAALQRRGGRIHVLAAILPHHLSSNDDSTADPIRQQAVLDAERRFYRLHGTFTTRLLRRLRLLRAVVGRILRRRPWPHTRRILRAALQP